jgi:hypothetical protein
MKDSRPQYLANVKRGVAQYMSEAHRLGLGDVASRSWRFSTLQDLKARGAVLRAPSNAYMTSRLVPIPAKRAVQLCRTGVLYTSRRAQLYGHRDDDACPLCGGKDGVSHALGGCQHKTLRGMFQERHNALGRMVLAEVAKGSLGGALKQSDVGNHSKMEAGGLPEALCSESARRIPRRLLPASLTDAEWTALKPDGLLVWRDRKAKLRRVVVIELKVTNDLDPGRALDAAAAQHSRLLDLLTRPRDRAKTAPPKLATIAVGATGVTFTDSRSTLIDLLGVEAPRADALLENMALALARATAAIIRQRRRLEGPRVAVSGGTQVEGRNRTLTGVT